jgi:adenosine deaminase/adenosine deaminase CECR1
MEVLRINLLLEHGRNFSNKRSTVVINKKIMEKWSIKDYNHVSYPSDKLFLSLCKFSPAIAGILAKAIGTKK